MNDLHLELCAGEEWRTYINEMIVPWLLGKFEVSGDVLEVGPGPGLMTDALHPHVRSLTAVEVDPMLAGSLRARYLGTNVEVLQADATQTGLPDDRFDAALCFTMLHHVPTRALQSALIVEMFRVLAPGGLFVGADGLDSEEMRALHIDDVFNPVDPATFETVLRAAGFAEPVVRVRDNRMLFSARKP